jgi:hypothetical protein
MDEHIDWPLADVGPACLSLQLRNHAVERRKPLLDEEGTVARAKEALCSANQRDVARHLLAQAEIK